MKAKPRFPTGPRLKIAREASGCATAKLFAETNEIRPGTYSGHEAGTRNLDLETAETYARILKIRAAWLAFGEEPMTADAAQPEAEEQAPLADRVVHLVGTLNELLSHKPIEDGYVGIAPIARKLAEVIERAGFSHAPSKSEPTSASQS